jgi:putative pyrroloquinoline-quinone-binding quinoprotein
MTVIRDGSVLRIAKRSGVRSGRAQSRGFPCESTSAPHRRPCPQSTVIIANGMVFGDGSGDTITSFNQFSGITVANGKVYLGTHDGTLWCFRL